MVALGWKMRIQRRRSHLQDFTKDEAVSQPAERKAMHRRAFIGILAGGFLAPSSGVNARQTNKVYRIGWLDFSSSAENLGIFRQAMGAFDWIEDRTFRIDYRGGEGRTDRLAAVAAELVRLPSDVIVAPGTSEVFAARKATASIPIVIVGVDDPVGRGLVAALARPNGNVTGIAGWRNELSGKLLSLLREFVPDGSGVSVLWDTTDPDHRPILDHLQAAATVLGLSLQSVPVERASEVEAAFVSIRDKQHRMLIVPFSVTLVPTWIADLALRHRLLLASTTPAYAYEGGLMAYTEDWNATFNRAANFVDRILKGAKPALLPIELPSQFKLIVNAATAQRLGLAIPPAIMVQADYIID
jgi:putative ABC transport system substrate-binding protein